MLGECSRILAGDSKNYSDAFFSTLKRTAMFVAGAALLVNAIAVSVLYEAMRVSALLGTPMIFPNRAYSILLATPKVLPMAFGLCFVISAFVAGAFKLFNR